MCVHRNLVCYLKTCLNFFEEGLDQIAKIQNLSENKLNQITKMHNQSRDDLEKN